MNLTIDCTGLKRTNIILINELELRLQILKQNNN